MCGPFFKTFEPLVITAEQIENLAGLIERRDDLVRDAKEYIDDFEAEVAEVAEAISQARVEIVRMVDEATGETSPLDLDTEDGFNAALAQEATGLPF